MTRHTPYPSHCHEVSPLTPKERLRSASVRCMVHSVPSFMTSCSARCRHNQGIRTHPPPHPMEGALISPSGVPHPGTIY
ncbi:hypothetical protein E2C01_084694 [Portunus trituberculatus]|uniref:Uncharacterized protein n=1 Tax=Portunus trituberculatus TaxID=210409 RepID=A0A5B7J4P1_PORTR|nr:hypothetical protein [Portunus trituberculatus]